MNIGIPDRRRLEVLDPPVGGVNGSLGWRDPPSPGALGAHGRADEPIGSPEQLRDRPRDVVGGKVLEACEADHAVVAVGTGCGVPGAQKSGQGGALGAIDLPTLGIQSRLAGGAGRHQQEALGLGSSRQIANGFIDLMGGGGVGLGRSPLQRRVGRGPERGRLVPVEDLEAGPIGARLEVEPERAEGMVAVYEALGERAPGLGVERRVVEQLGVPLSVFRFVPGMPGGGQRAAFPRRETAVEEAVFAASLGVAQGPDPRHPLAIDQHHGGVPIRDRQVAVAVHVQIEQLGGIGEIDLILVVVDGAPPPSGVVGNRKPVVREARRPEPFPIAGQILHQVDLVHPRGIPHLLDGPEEHALGSELGRLGAQEDSHRGPGTGGGPRSHRQNDPLGHRAHEFGPR